MKKRMVFLAALALCAGLLCGCGDGSPASGTESTPAETSLPESQASLAGKESSQDGEESGPVESPPYLEVSSGGSDVQAARSTYGWTVLIDDRTTKGDQCRRRGPREHGEAAALAGRRRNSRAFLGWARAGQRVRGRRSYEPVGRRHRRPTCEMRWGQLPAAGGGMGLHGIRHLGQLGGLGWLRLVLCGNYRIAAGKEASPVCIENTILKAKAVAFFPVLWYISHQ